ncbi:hypothetical protein J4E83_010113 [Alternaria metachromatica]|uniref:uncharacterized protein n=1 Tax=Alternaria metachromatica TaxID=283354 RepID=UPI0020C5613C|nr:uncharacterized protein J4E83_010113 [Alternaria metachromatica]KAI4606305.1 hypothetical protein J4E83_010113 [Alternaria metachromatica]
MSKDKRRSIFGRGSLNAFASQSNKDESQPSNLLRKRRTASFMSNLSDVSQYTETASTNGSTVAGSSHVRETIDGQRPSLSKNSLKRASSVFSSFRGYKLSADDDPEPLSATSTRTSTGFGEYIWEDVHDRQVLQHGEVQTSSSMFRKKREYLVLTERHLIRFKNHAKAIEAFPGIPSPNNRMSYYRHSHSPSTGSSHELQSMASESSGDRHQGIPLRHIVAVYHLDDGRPHFALELYYLDDETNNASSMTLQFGDPEEMFSWLKAIRGAANRARLSDAKPISAHNSHLAARVVEAERDYVPPHYAIYKVVLRPQGKTTTRASTDDLAKVSASVCFLAIGVHKVHIIPLFKPSSQRSSSPSLAAHNTQSSHGILTLTEVCVTEIDDTFQLTFRKPLERPKVLHLASLASRDIAVRLRSIEASLRPEWETRPFDFLVPDEVYHDVARQESPHPMDQDSLDRTLIGYCVAYDVQPENISYQITYPAEDAPRFELLPPVGLRRAQYNTLELLAVMRALRYNETFGGISFKDVKLDVLNGLKDPNGAEHLCLKTKRGTYARLDIEELERSCLLVQEIRALALTNRKLRRMDFTSCISRKPRDHGESRGSARDQGCGIVEALFPLCKYQTTNVDWIALNKIQLGDTDLDYLVAAGVERACHFRGLELSGCGLTDRSLSLVLDAIRAQETTLEALDLSSNPFRLSPSMFDSQIGVFGYLTRLNLSHVARSSGLESLISVETFAGWRLQELILSGTSLNSAMVDAIAGYLVNYKQSSALRELRLDHCFLTGSDIAYLLHSMTEHPGKARELHLDVSENNIEEDLDKLTRAISKGLAPSNFTLRLLEFEEDADFRKMILALAANNTIRQLDISRASLPCDASEETCQAMEKMFADNTSLEWLDISGEDSRLETTKLGVGINRALRGLQRNKTLRALYIRYQKLGVQGASTLADVLKVNTTLQYLYCEDNGIALTGFTDLVNALHRNTTLLFLPTMQESRQMALKQTEDQVKSMRDDVSLPTSSKSSSVRSRLTNRVVSGKSSKEPNYPMGLSDQDIKAALGLVDESWARQEYRLQQYLQRNHNLAHGIPTAMDVDEEDFERPDTANSLGKILEKVTIESTPTREKDVQLGMGMDMYSPKSKSKPSEKDVPQLGVYTPEFYLPELNTPGSGIATPRSEVVDYDVTPLEKELEMSFGENRRAFPFPTR